MAECTQDVPKVRRRNVTLEGDENEIMMTSSFQVDEHVRGEGLRAYHRKGEEKGGEEKGREGKGREEKEMMTSSFQVKRTWEMY